MLPILKNKVFFPSFMDDYFERDFLPGVFHKPSNFTTPAVNVIEEKDEFVIEVAAPGLSKEDFKIDIDNSILVISCEKETKNEEKKDNYMRREFNYSSFKRSFTLPDSIMSDKIKASHNDGILKINIPKKEEVIEKPIRQIKIS